jgi:hypothetical protein
MRTLLLLLSALMLSSCIFDEKAEIVTIIQTLRTEGHDSGGVSLMMSVGGRVTCRGDSAQADSSIWSGDYEEILLISLDSPVGNLDDMTVGMHEGRGISSSLDILSDYEAEVTVTAVTSTTISGNFRFLDDVGNVVRASQHFDALKCPDVVWCSGCAP